MPNIALALKAEIARVARKELRAELDGMRKITAVFRSEIASLKRQVRDLERQSKSAPKRVPLVQTPENVEDGTPRRFSAKGLATLRKRLGLSAGDLALLIGASRSSIYSWEAGETRPHAAHVAAIAMLRGIGRKEAAARLQDLG